MINTTHCRRSPINRPTRNLIVYGTEAGELKVLGANGVRAIVNPNLFIQVMSRPGQQHIEFYSEERQCDFSIYLQPSAMLIIREHINIQIGLMLLQDEQLLEDLVA